MKVRVVLAALRHGLNQSHSTNLASAYDVICIRIAALPTPARHIQIGNSWSGLCLCRRLLQVLHQPKGNYLEPSTRKMNEIRWSKLLPTLNQCRNSPLDVCKSFVHVHHLLCCIAWRGSVRLGGSVFFDQSTLAIDTIATHLCSWRQMAFASVEGHG